MKTKLISILMVTVLVLGALLTSCAPDKKESQVAKYLNKILEATFAGTETVEPQVTTSKITLNNTPGLGIPHFVGAEMTLTTGIAGEIASTADVTLDNGKFDLSVYNAGMAVVVGSSVLGSGTYGFELSDLDALMTLFGSIFAPGAPEESPAETTAEGMTANGLLASLGGINSLLDGTNPEKVYSLLEKYTKIIADVADSACNGSVKTDNGITVTVEFNTDSAKKIVKDVFSALKKDKELKSIIESVLVTSGMPKEEADAQLDAIFSDESASAIYDTLDAAPFTFKATVNASNDYVLNDISVEVKSQGATYTVFFNGKTEGKIELGYGISMTFEGETFKQETKVVLENKTVDGADVFEINLVSNLDGTENTECLLKASVKDGKYSVTVRMQDDIDGNWDLTVAGTVETVDNKTTATVSSATAHDNTIALDITVETTLGGTFPTIPTDFKNILDVTGDEFGIIMDNIENSPLGQFIPKGDLGGNFDNELENDVVVLPDVE